MHAAAGAAAARAGDPALPARDRAIASLLAHLAHPGGMSLRLHGAFAVMRGEAFDRLLALECCVAAGATPSLRAAYARKLSAPKLSSLFAAELFERGVLADALSFWDARPRDEARVHTRVHTRTCVGKYGVGSLQARQCQAALLALAPGAEATLPLARLTREQFAALFARADAERCGAAIAMRSRTMGVPLSHFELTRTDAGCVMAVGFFHDYDRYRGSYARVEAGRRWASVHLPRHGCWVVLAEQTRLTRETSDLAIAICADGAEAGRAVVMYQP
jgi:hypothetical protein